VQHYFDFFGQAEVDLYEGRPEAAWQRVVSAWPGFRRSLLRRIQLVFLESCYLHARAVLAGVAAGALPASALRLAERDARNIENAGMAWSDPFAQLIRASVAALQGRAPDAISALASAETGFETADAGLYAAAARARRGDLIGGMEGEKLIAEADAWMIGQRVASPSRMRLLLTPGKWKTA
jgi:hypothetical protein